MNYAASNDSRRKYPRRDFVRVIGILVRGEYFLAQTGEIGEGGVLLKRVPRTLEVSDPCLLTFFVNPETFVSVRAIVRNAKSDDSGQACYGLQFEGLPLGTRRIIRNYVADAAA